MPVCSDIQEALRVHEQWLIGLRQHPAMTTAKIQTRLDNERGLKATPSQLETFFRHLGQRKNLSRHEWIAIFRALDSQAAFGNRFDLYISGKLLTEQELKKKRKNAKPPQPLAEDPVDADRLIKKLPNGVTIQKLAPRRSPSRSPQRSITPRLIAQEVSHIAQDLGAGMLDDLAAPNGILPVENAILHERGVGFHSLGLVNGSPSIRNQARHLSFPSNAEEFSFLQASYESEVLGIDGWNSSSMLSPRTLDRLLRPLSPEAFSRSLQSPGRTNLDDLWIPGFNYTSPTQFTPGHCAHDLSPIESARLLLGGPGHTIARGGMLASNELSPTPEELLDKLQSLVLVNADGGFCGQYEVVNGAGVFTDQFIQMLLFSVVNNLAGLDTTPTRLIIKFINEHEPARQKFLGHLRTGVSNIYSRALAENLLKAAITACDARTVHDLLALNIVKPDDIVFVVDYGRKEHERRMTAIEKAAELRQLDFSELLLRFDADVNKTYKPHWSRHEEGALECAIGLWGEYRQIDIRLVHLLLENGATVKARLIDAAVRWGDTALIDKLMSKISSSEHQCFFQMDTISRAAQYLKNDAGYRFVRQVMQTCQSMHDSACLAVGHRLAGAISQAARRDNRDLVDLLLPHASQLGLDWALTAAARFGSHSLVQLLIAHGAPVNGKLWHFDNDRIGTTPLAEALRKNDDELVEILAKEGAWKQIEEPRSLEAVLCAVAESGSSAYLSQILQLVRAPERRALDSALFYATNAGHEEIALKLLEAGANSTNSHGESTLLQALRMKSHSITRAMLECEMSLADVMDERILEAAIAWGDLEIIKAIFSLGGNINNYLGRPPLSFAIKAGKRSIIDFMISLGADLSTNQTLQSQSLDRTESSSPLAAAVLVRDETIARILLHHGADPADEQAIINAVIHDRSLLNLTLQFFRQRYPQVRTGFGGKVLLHTLKTRDEGALDLFLGAGFDVNIMICDHEWGMVSALGFAVAQYQNHLQTISKLLNAGGDPNSTTSMKGDEGLKRSPDVRKTLRTTAIRQTAIRQTALLDAIKTKSLPLVELLVSGGADVQKEAKLGLRRTPLQKACEVGSHSIVDFLLRHNTDVNAAPAPRHGATALQIAAKMGSLRMAKKLLDLGARVDAPGVQTGGRSAIEYAAEYGRLDMIPLLFNASGGKFVSDQCTSAIALARENGHLVCAGLLTELSTRNQAFLDVSGMADHDGVENVLS